MPIAPEAILDWITYRPCSTLPIRGSGGERDSASTDGRAYHRRAAAPPRPGAALVEKLRSARFDDPPLDQEVAQGAIHAQNRGAIEITMAGPPEGKQAIGHPGVGQRLVKPLGLLEGDDRIGLAVRGEDGGRPLSDVGDRRDPTRQRGALGATAHPPDREVAWIRRSQQLGHVD